MRSRRGKRLSQKQLAELLFESEEAIKMLENGKIPENAEKLILKLEQYFQITLNLEPKKEKKPEDIRFDKYTINRLTIGDLRSLQKNREVKKETEPERKADEIVDEVKTEESEVIGDDIELED